MTQAAMASDPSAAEDATSLGTAAPLAAPQKPKRTRKPSAQQRRKAASLRNLQKAFQRRRELREEAAAAAAAAAAAGASGFQAQHSIMQMLPKASFVKC